MGIGAFGRLTALRILEYKHGMEYRGDWILL
jgi:hypothetical protein